jgi:hypothetical protein
LALAGLPKTLVMTPRVIWLTSSLVNVASVMVPGAGGLVAGGLGVVVAAGVGVTGAGVVTVTVCVVVCTGVVVAAGVEAAGVDVGTGGLAAGVVAGFGVAVVPEWDACTAAGAGFACLTPARRAAAEDPRGMAVALARGVVGETVGVVAIPAGLENTGADALLAGLDEPV